MTESFIRQRKNVFIVNGILLFSFLAKVEISKLTFAGISFSGFGNPQAVYCFLWIMWGYFGYRFVIYFIEDEKESFSDCWERELERKVSPALMGIAKKSAIDTDNEEELNEESVAGYYQTKRNNWILHFQKNIGSKYSTHDIENVKLPISRRKIIAPTCFAVARFCFLTPVLTNYILPLVLCFFVFLVVGFAAWEGALPLVFS